MLGALVTYSSCSSAESTEFTYLNHQDHVAYVGMDKCASCHGDKHSTFVHTGMGLSYDSATRQKSSAEFGSKHQVYDSVLNFYYKPFWKDEKLFIKEFRLEGRDTTHQKTVLINHIVGSGQHTNSHLFTENGYVYQAPITYYVQEGKWDLAPGFENGNNSRFNRILNSECISCHNSMPKLAAGSDYKFEKIGNGIDCERCHGPGELHVKQRQNGDGVDVSQEIDPTIVNPRKLSWERQIDLCQRCHLQGLNVLKKGKKFTDFKPGMQLKDIFEIYLPKYEGGDQAFDMANHSQRFQLSECFIQGNKNGLDFTCISCHNPHVSVKITGKEVYNSACKNCHQLDKCSEDLAVRNAIEDNCVTCHMPQSGSEDIPHVSVHDHYIRVPQPREKVAEMKRLIGLYAVNNSNPNPQDEILAYLEYWEKFDKNPFYLQKAKELLEGTNYSQLWLKYYYLTEDYSKAVAFDFTNVELSSWEYFMLGESFAKVKQMSQAFYYLEQAFKLDSTNKMVGERLLHYYVKGGKLEKGSDLGELLMREFSSSGLINNSLAKINIMQGNSLLGKKYLDAALQLSPDDVQIWITHFNYYLRSKNQTKTKYWGERILDVKPDFIEKDKLAQLIEDMT